MKLNRFYMKKMSWINMLILVVLIVHLLLKSYFHHDGRISPDSAEYLSAAQSILNGDGLFTGSNPVLGADKSYFSIWPAGYPLLIALISLLTNSSVFWGSKLVNIIMLLASALLLKTIYGRKSFLFIAIFGFASYLFLFSSTYSEAPFTFSLIYLSWSLYNFNKEKASWSACIHLSIAAILPFLFRYIGVFTCFLLLGLLLRSVLSNGFKLRAKRILLVLIITGVFELMYLVINLLNTGNLTGISRPSGFHEPLSITVNFIKGILGEVVLIAPYYNVFLLFVTLMVLVLVWTYKKKITSYAETDFSSKYFLIVGVCYLFTFFVMGYIFRIRTFDYRFLSPGTLMIIFWIIDYFLRRNSSFLEGSILSFFMLSLLFSVRESFNGYSRENTIYSKKIYYLQEEISSVEAGSIIIKGNKHYKYLRPDIIIFDSWYLNDTISERRLINEYPDRKIYLQDGEHINRVQ